MSSKYRKTEPLRKASVWSTISAAVQAGWGPTGRLLTIIALVGLFALGFTLVAKDSETTLLLRALVSLLR